MAVSFVSQSFVVSNFSCSALITILIVLLFKTFMELEFITTVTYGLVFLFMRFGFRLRYGEEGSRKVMPAILILELLTFLFVWDISCLLLLEEPKRFVAVIFGQGCISASCFAYWPLVRIVLEVPLFDEKYYGSGLMTFIMLSPLIIPIFLMGLTFGVI